MFFLTNASKMTINLFLVLGFSFFAYSLGDSSCGPDSCSSLENVKKCNNVQYCISEIWVKRAQTGFKDNVCQICLEMVKEARDQLQSNETQNEIKQVLEGSCKLMGFKPAVEICMKLADEFEVELVQMLASQMDPETVCSVAKLCFNNNLQQVQLKSNECVTCQKFITSAAEVLVKAPESDLMNQFINVCRSMSSYSDACTFYLLQDPISIINQTRLALLKQPCEHANFCPLGGTPAVKDTLSQHSTWQESKKKFCSLCPAMMGNLHALINDLESESNLMRWTHDLCSSLSLPRHVCKKFVKEHHNLLRSYFTSKVDYNYICTYGLGLCGKESESPPIWPLLPVIGSSEKFIENGEALLETTKLMEVKAVQKKEKLQTTNRVQLSLGDPLPEPFRLLPLTQILIPDDSKCLACGRVFNVISQYINTHEDYVHSLLNNTCRGTKNYKECSAFSNSYENLFKEYGNLKSEKVCPLLVPFCDVKLYEPMLMNPKFPEESCRFCVDVLDSLNLKIPKTEAAEVQIKKELKNKICEKVPEDLQSLCIQITESYFKSMIASVTSDMDSIDTCDYLKLCDSNQMKDILPPPKENNHCQSCMLVMQTVYDEMEGKTGRKDIQEILKSLCGELPSKTKSTCYLLVDVYGDELVDLIMDNITPEMICHKLHFCPASNRNNVVAPKKVRSNIPCNFCMTALNMVISQLQDNKTEESIKKALNHLCSYMPEEVRDTCSNLMSEYAEDIIDMILADFNATEICIYLKMCGPKSDIDSRKQPSSVGFSIATNEVWRKYNPQGACHFCRILEKSMAVTGHEEQGAEEMLGLLTDVCLMDSSKKHGDCGEKFVKEIVPFGKKALLKMSNICEEMKICSDKSSEEVKVDDRLFYQIQKAVEECAMCENIVGIVSRQKKMKAKMYDFAENATRYCLTVPKDKQKMCSSMLTSYAPSIVNLLTLMKVNENDVCFELKLCEKSSQTKVNMPVTSIEQSGLSNLNDSGECLKGPSFWCANLINAKKCGTVPHCKEMVWKNKKF